MWTDVRQSDAAEWKRLLLVAGFDEALASNYAALCGFDKGGEERSSSSPVFSEEIAS